MFRSSRLSRVATGAVTLVSYVGVTLAPSLAFAQEGERRSPMEVGSATRVGGGSLSSAGDRSSAATEATGAARALAPTLVGAASEQVDGEASGVPDTAGAASGDGTSAGQGDSDQNSDETESGSSSENDGAPNQDDSDSPQPATTTLGLPSGDDKSGVTSQTISLPKGAGSIKGMEESFSAQLSTGIATFSVPFALMKARGGVSPSLGLSYSSAGGSGPAGQGWSVGVPFIARQTDRGLPKYLDGCNSKTAPGFDCKHPNSWHPEQDRFVFNGGQELVPICTVIDGACDGALTDAETGVSGLAGSAAVLGVNEAFPAWANGYQYFRPRVEGSFLRFFWAEDHQSWIVQDKSGTFMELGSVGSKGPAPGGMNLAGVDALERNPKDSKQIYRWHLSRQYDQHITDDVPLNLVVYDYTQQGGQAYLTDIFDTTPAELSTSTDPNNFAHHTHLRWEERPDVTEGYRSGWLMRSELRLGGVDVTSKPFVAGVGAARRQVRRYHLEYSADFHRSLLNRVQVEGRCGGSEDDSATPSEQGGLLPPSTNCGLLPPMEFAYSEVDGYEPDGSSNNSRLDGYMPFDGRVQVLADSPDHSLDEGLTDFFDINSDGLPDVLVTAPGLYGNGHAFFQNGVGGQLGFADVQLMGVKGVLGADANTLKLSNLNVSPQDVDGDGHVNLLHMPRYKQYAIYDPRLIGSKWYWVGRAVETASGQNVKIDFGNDTLDTQIADINFDGLVDVVVSTGTQYQTFFSLGRYPGGDGQFGQARRTGASSASINNDPVAKCVPHSGLPVRFSDADVKMSDMNGDGILDIVRVRRGDIQYWPGRGNGYFGTGDLDCPGGEFQPDEYKEMVDAPQYSDIQGSTLRLNDVNGDGLDDLVQFRFDAVDIWLNIDGTGWTDRFILEGTPYHAGYHNRVRLTDVNGSGTPDIVWGDAKSYKYIDLQGGKKPYLLVEVKNGLGKSTELEYSTSTQEMLTAAASGNSCGEAPEEDRFAAEWCSVMPTVTHVVKRVTEKDNIEIRGRPPASYVTEYEYRDPVYEGRQREFRGFARARARRIGDANSPTDMSESVFLLGECLDPSDGSPWDGEDQTHFCAPPNRSADNPFEALKGLPVETHKMDAFGVHLASTENEYTIRTLYEGLDGRAVRHAFLSQTDSLLYDTGAGDPGRMDIARRGFYDEDYGVGDDLSTQTSPAAGVAGMAHLRTASQVDRFGNKIQAKNEGCVAGGECPGSHDLFGDETIFQITLPELVDSDTISRWMWRTGESYIIGSGAGAVARNRSRSSFDALGRPIKAEAFLAGVDEAGPIERVDNIPGPGGAATDDNWFTQSATLYDEFGNARRTRGANGRCAEVTYDLTGGFALFAKSESIQTSGSVVSVVDPAAAINTACVADLTTTASYDHGLGTVTYATDLNLRDTKAVYDEFGRITALHKPSATKSNTAEPNHQDAPSVQIQYYLPTDLGGTLHSIIHTQTQDGTDETDTTNQIHSYAYVDGFGRTLVTLSEADPSTGEGGGHDGGAWIAGSLIEWDQKSAVAKKYMPFFWDGDPMAFDYSDQPTTEYGRQRYDAFGRQVQTYDLDGTITLQSRYHALSTDLWDAADLTPGPHQHSYASERKDGHGRTVQTTERFRDHGVMEERHVQTTYLPTGEPLSIKRTRGSGPAAESVVRWMHYDSLGRMLLNVEPNTTEGYTSTPGDDPSGSIKAWRYQYNFAGDLIATSDARGCGQNFYYDGAGRILGEDYAPCEAHQAAYSAPAGSDYSEKSRDAANLEVIYYYDDPSNLSALPAGIVPANWDAGGFATGRAIAVLDRGSASFTTFDGRGRTVRTQTKLVRPIALVDGQAQQALLAERYAPRVYERNMSYDAADREVSASTGLQELRASTGNTVLDQFLAGIGEGAGQSNVTTSYSRRGAVKSSGSSYGSLVSDITRTADNLVTGITYGDAAQTRTTYLYDERRRISSVQTYRGPPGSGYWTFNSTSGSEEPTQQMVLQDEDFIYDVVGNPVEVRDWRDPQDWPAGAKPVTKKIEYDDLYRATRIKYEYSDGDDDWKSPFDAENNGDVGGAAGEAPKRAQPSPHIAFQKRILEQTFEYDWVGNNQKTTDDADGFYDRSLGDIESDDGDGVGENLKPYQLRSATGVNGHLEARYDVAGNMTRLAVERTGTCLPAGSVCDQLFDYQWDEVGRLVRARRWDTESPDADTTTLPNGAPAADLRYGYDASDQRVIKEAVDQDPQLGEQKSYTLYIFASLELRRSQFGDYGENSADDYELSHWTISPYLMANGVRLARLVYNGSTVPMDDTSTGGGPGDVNASTSQLHVFFELGDHLGSTSVVLDKATGELVERSTFQGYGGAESDYRPGRWGSFREDYRFTGKEEDVEVGLQYFGKRFLNPLLGRWVSADPLAVHAPGEADLNVYAYVHGKVLKNIDPLGLRDGPSADVKEAQAIGAEAERAEYDRQSGLDGAQASLDQARKNQRADAHSPGRKDKRIAAAEEKYKKEVAEIEATYQKRMDQVEARIQRYEGDVDTLITHFKIGATKSENGREGLKQAVEIVLVTAVTEGMGAVLRLARVGRAASGMSKAGGSASRAIQKVRDICPCFAEDTLVQTVEGLVPISAVQVGDLVLARDEATGDLAFKPVARVYITPNKELLELTFESALGELEKIEATPGHPFWVDGRGWVNAAELHLDEPVMTAESGMARLVAALSLEGSQTVYNLEVADFHTYFVGEGQHWVHNQCSCGPRTLYHYTDDAGLEGITSSRKLNPSTKAKNPNDVRYGDGQYLSDIAPGTQSNAQLSRKFINNPFQGRKFSNYVEVDVTGLPVVKGRDGVFVVPNSEPLDLTTRLVSSGKNTP